MVNVGSVSSHHSSNHFQSQDHGDSEFNDPANWDAASYETDLAASMGEPAEVVPNAYREKALDCMALLKAVDDFMAESRDPRLAWVGISMGLGLYSTRGLTAAELARQMRCGEREVKCSTNLFLKLASLPPAEGRFAPWI
jgi:hypothetical protein